MSRFDNHEILEGPIVTDNTDAALATAYINRKPANTQPTSSPPSD